MTRSRTALAAVVLALLAFAGCGQSGQAGQVDQEAVDKLADQARGHIDDLAAMVGTQPEVRQDVLTDCVPGNTDSGKELIYMLRVSTEPGARDRLLSEIRQKWETRGWTAKTGGSGDLQLLKGSFTMGARVSTDGTVATVGGSGGCVD